VVRTRSVRPRPDLSPEPFPPTRPDRIHRPFRPGPPIPAGRHPPNPTDSMAKKKASKKAASKKGAKKVAAGDLLISKSRVKHLASMNVASDFYAALDESVRGLIAKAEQRAEHNGRKTLRPQDL
jgi:histone H3/H4